MSAYQNWLSHMAISGKEAVESLWQECLIGLSVEEIKMGINKIKSGAYSDKAPTPMQFRELCLPTLEERGFPETAIAFTMFMKDSNTLPIFQEAKRHLDMYALRMMSYGEARRYFESVYSIVRKRIIEKENFEMMSRIQNL